MWVKGALGLNILTPTPPEDFSLDVKACTAVGVDFCWNVSHVIGWRTGSTITPQQTVVRRKTRRSQTSC